MPGIVIITHKMREVRDIADRVTVLRAGRVVLKDVTTADISSADLVTAMVGESVEPVHNDGSASAADSATSSTTCVALTGIGEGSGLRAIWISVRAGRDPRHCRCRRQRTARTGGRGRRGPPSQTEGEIELNGESVAGGDPKAFRQPGWCRWQVTRCGSSSCPG